MTMSQVAAVGKIHAENLITILYRSQVNRHVCLCAAVWLDVGVVGAEEFLGSIDCLLLNDISPFATAVVALAWIAFSILVCKYGSGSFEHGFTDKVLGS